MALLDKGDIKRHTMTCKINDAYLSVAICSFAIDVRSSWLVAADRLVSGVLMELPPVEPGGVDDVTEELRVLALAACLAAFSARRFCFDADVGGMVVRRETRRSIEKCR